MSMISSFGCGKGCFEGVSAASLMDKHANVLATYSRSDKDFQKQMMMDKIKHALGSHAITRVSDRVLLTFQGIADFRRDVRYER